MQKEVERPYKGVEAISVRIADQADTIATLQAKLDKAVAALALACEALAKSDRCNSKGARIAQSLIKELRP